MALEVATGSFQITTGTVGATVSVTTLSFQPKVVLFSWSGRTAVGQAEGTHRLGVGYMVSATDRGGSTSKSVHSSANSNSHSRLFDNAAITVLANNGTLDGAADFDAFLSNGFRVIIDDQFAADYTINYLAIGGGDLTNVASVTATTPAATGDQDITTVGFQPDAAFIFMAGATAINTSDTWSVWNLGVAAGATITNALLFGGAEDGIATMNTKSYCRAGECVANVDFLFTTTLRAAVTAWLSNGFRLNYTETINGLSIRALCLKGGKYFVGDILTQTNTTNFSETGVGFQPKALVFGSHNKVASTADTLQDHDERTVGFAVSATQRNSIGFID